MNSTVRHSIDHLLARVRGEYIEMPGLKLTEAQAQRLWGLDNTTCQHLLGRLCEAQFLARTPDGHYYRADQIVAVLPEAWTVGRSGSTVAAGPR